jgi:hypothetical protein
MPREQRYDSKGPRIPPVAFWTKYSLNNIQFVLIFWRVVSFVLTKEG